MSNQKLYTPEPASAPGDFYNVQGECVSCGVPHAVAPDLVGWIGTPINPEMNCYWIKQPETPGEFERAFKVLDGQEVGCHRYAGSDPLVQMRVGYENCDDVPSSLRRGVGGLYSALWGHHLSYEAPADRTPGLLRRFWMRLMRTR